MKRSEVAVRYAKALFDIAEEKGTVEAVNQELGAFSEAVSKNPIVLKLVRNSAVSTKEKELFLEKILNGKASPLVLNFLKVLLNKKRLADLGIIQLEFQRIFEQKQGIKEISVISAVPLSESFKTRLSAHLSKTLKTKIRMLSEVRPKILGGIILRFGHHQYNASFRNRLETIRQRLLA
jgi:F-type H+-transporting ATPase subunit delta